MNELNLVRTKEGWLPVVGLPVGEFLLIHPSGNEWVYADFGISGEGWNITHRATGLALAQLTSAREAHVVAKILDLACRLDWDDAENIPKETKEKCAALFFELRSIVNFVVVRE
jgi:hypothetical protein